MTQRENVLKMLNHEPGLEWIPMGFECFDIVLPTDVIRERPTPQEGDGADWFGCEWIFDPITIGFTPKPGHIVCPDITKWREYVRFPDLDAVDWEKSRETTGKWDRENKLSYMMWESGCWERLH